MRGWRWLIGGALGLLLAAGLLRLRLDTDVLGLLPDDLPTVAALKLQDRHFTPQRDLVLGIEGDDPDVNREAARTVAEALRGVPGLVRWAVWTAPWEEHPEDAIETVAFAWLQGEPAEVERLVARLAPDPLAATLAAARRELATALSPDLLARRGYDPMRLLEGPGGDEGAGPIPLRFARDDGRWRWVHVTPPARLAGYRETREWLRQVRSVVDGVRQSGFPEEDLQFRYTGGPAFTAEISAGMERDMRRSALGTAAFIAIAFGWMHRRLRPLAWLLALLALTLVATLSAGGLVLGRLNAVSLGFAAILLGLAADFGLVLYQEAAAHPEAAPDTVRRRVGPGIAWAAATTAAAFGMLGFSGLPGLVQLGVLVAGGALLGAGILLAFYPGRIRVDRSHAPPGRGLHLPDRAAWVLTILLPVVAGGVLAVAGWPRIDRTADPLRPGRSEAQDAWDEMARAQGTDWTRVRWLVASGPDVGSVAAQLRVAERRLEDAARAGASIRHQLPTALWPDPERQAINRPRLAALGLERERLRSAVLEAGFTEEAFRTADALLEFWVRAAPDTGVTWPAGDSNAWLLSRFTARDPTSRTGDVWLALGMVQSDPGPGMGEWQAPLRSDGISIGGWESLGEELIDRVASRLVWVGGLCTLVWAILLWLAFRSVLGVVLAAAGVGGGTLLLLAWMAVAGWEWNLMNLMALPLLVGAGTDYAIHLQLALRRHGGDLAAVQRTVGRAILLCAATTAVGFASLSGSNNAGLASLGSVCAAGLICIYLVSGQLLPAWWRRWHRKADPRPSELYGPRTWRAACRLARTFPRPWLRRAAAVVALTYAALRPGRRRVVAGNLLPLVNGDVRAARRAAWRVFARFGGKLVDLWGCESGATVDRWFATFSGWEHLVAARERGRGVLLVTLHVGNWELGAPLLASRGIPVVVISGPEPGAGFTEHRRAARAQRGIETVIVGEDPFDAVEISRRLRDGAVVALLMDRPPPARSVAVQWFGRPFAASVAVAELARATGCTVLPTVMVEVEGRYAAQLYPPVPYDAASLRPRENQGRFTEDILRAFEPALRQHPDQWFHFVPVWPSSP
ncbi:MAG: MMPL family transporter [Verrucomicrobiae bacterium]|nr:MMPL family transporter [Verrucomicrobiae bacterium]